MSQVCALGAASRPWTIYSNTKPSKGKHSIVQSRRGGLLVSAKKNKNNAETVESILQWTATVQKHMIGLRSELMETEKNVEKKEKQTSVSNVDAAVSSMERVLQELLDRQDKFFREEREYWLTERAEWKKHESELRKEITRLQGLVLGQNTLVRNSVPANVSTETSTEDGSEEERFQMKMDVKESIIAAISAVNNGDVLSEEYTELLRLSANGIQSTVKVPEAVTEEEAPIESVKSPPTGPPPTLSVGDDDIYWVSQLQEALNQNGYFCGNDDVEDFYFGEGTLSALLTYQACSGLEETGFTDAKTWKALLGSDLKPVIGNMPVENKEEMNGNVAVPEKKDTEDKEDCEEIKEFPVLSELDGGKEVHYLQVMLEIAGYSCGKDDMMWWHYGDETIAAMKTFQACNGLPQSGVADKQTWISLIGNGKTMKDVIKLVKKQQLYEEDLSKSDRVWLLGEQRWERKL